MGKTFQPEQCHPQEEVLDYSIPFHQAHTCWYLRLLDFQVNGNPEKIQLSKPSSFLSKALPRRPLAKIIPSPSIRKFAGIELTL